MSFPTRLLLLAPLLAWMLFPAGAQADETTPCDVGVYRGPDGNFATIVERDHTAETGEYRYTFRGGEFGSTKGGLVRCVPGAIEVGRKGRAPERWPAVPLKLTPTRFESGDVTLAGLLIEPDVEDGQYPLVVAVHGSESTASIRRNSYPYIFAAQGIASFAYDKRGTGASEGAYHQNFHKLAADVVVASKEAKRLAKGRYSRFGLFGGSQGGWVAPRAANGAGADFVAVGFGLLIDPLEENAEQVFAELREAGHGDEVVSKAREITDATGAIMASHFESGYKQLASVKGRYGSEPWFAKIKGEFTGDILASDEATLRREGRARYDNLDIDWRYDAMGELRKVEAPQLWVVAGADREAPPLVTIERLQMLRNEGKDICIVRFPDTDHGMVEFTQSANGTREYTRITEGYFRLLGDWMKGVSGRDYGAAEFVSGARGAGC